MAICIWGRCTCPNHEPCAQHSGHQCGTWMGARIQHPREVNDAFTRDAELALVALDADRDLVRNMRAQLEQKRDELKRERADIQRVLNGPSTFSERRQTAGRIERGYRQLAQIQNDAQEVMSDLDSINARTSNAGSRISLQLIIPYTSPTGYCSCYDQKRSRLSAVALQMNVITARLNTLYSRRNAIRQEAIQTIGLIPRQTTIYRLLGSLFFAAVIIAFVFLSVTAAAVIALVGLLATAVVLLDRIIDHIDIDDQIMALRQELVRLWLAYYRLQSIATCRETPLNEEDDENEWWRDTLFDNPVEPESHAE